MDTSFVSYTGVPILPYVIVALNVQMSEPQATKWDYGSCPGQSNASIG